MSLLLFVMIAALVATDLTIEFRRGVPLALQSFELGIFVSALAGIAYHWWQAVADLRQTSERTVRQQALAIYRKSGLNGRSDLAAFFLEDLLLPSVRHPADAPPA